MIRVSLGFGLGVRVRLSLGLPRVGAIRAQNDRRITTYTGVRSIKPAFRGSMNFSCSSTLAAKHSQNNIKTLERMKRQATRFCKNEYSREPGSVTKRLQELGWESLQTRMKYKRITTLYKMEHNIIDIPLDQYIMHNTRCSRKHNSQFLKIRHSSNTFGNSVFFSSNYS